VSQYIGRAVYQLTDPLKRSVVKCGVPTVEEYWMVRSSKCGCFCAGRMFAPGCHSSHELVIATGGDIPAGTEPMLDVARAAVVLELGGRALRLQEAVAYA
jgi:hypothetical protein